MVQSAAYNLDIYQPRNPKASAYYKCVENHFEDLECSWDDMSASRYGFWRTYVMTVIYKYLDCGDLHMGFARVRILISGMSAIMNRRKRFQIRFCPLRYILELVCDETDARIPDFGELFMVGLTKSKFLSRRRLYISKSNLFMEAAIIRNYGE